MYISTFENPDHPLNDWTAPANGTVVFEATGPGGNAAEFGDGNGMGGGAWGRKTLRVAAGEVFDIAVGAFNTAICSYVSKRGAPQWCLWVQGGNDTNDGTPGLAVNCVADIAYSGGRGGLVSGDGLTGGGGGSSGGPSGPGTDGANGDDGGAGGTLSDGGKGGNGTLPDGTTDSPGLGGGMGGCNPLASGSVVYPPGNGGKVVATFTAD